jgi:DNA (cytosine-5)-methyltransferase 1
MRHGSLFTGIGGFDLAFENAEIETAWQVDKDKNCKVVLKKHFPKTRRYEDVKNVGKNTLSAVDIITGGFPCQDVSVAGKRAGLAGKRSGLWFEFARIVDELKPEWVVIENVTGLLSSNEGRDMETIVRTLAGFGYGVCWRCFDSQYFGLAQRRKRVFIVGHLGDGRAAKVLFESEGCRWDPPTRREAGEGTPPPTQEGFGHSGGKTFKINPVANTLNTQTGSETSAMMQGVVGALQARDHKGVGNQYVNEGKVIAFGAQNASAQELSASEEQSPTLNATKVPAVCGALQSRDHKGIGTTIDDKIVVEEKRLYQWSSGGGDDLKDTAQTLRSQAEHNYQVLLDTVWQMHHADEVIRENEKPVAPTLQERMGTGGNNVTMVGARRLTPTECERLQGFPDGWTAMLTDSARYRALGNAVSVPVAEWIARRIVDAENE